MTDTFCIQICYNILHLEIYLGARDPKIINNQVTNNKYVQKYCLKRKEGDETRWTVPFKGLLSPCSGPIGHYQKMRSSINNTINIIYP